jgi:Ser/Thr protein kinase RdoA (MazF antagonist)
VREAQGPLPDFSRLSDAEQVARLARLGRKALPAWGLPDGRLELLKYRENAVFSVTAPGGRRHVLRIHRPGYRTDAEIRSEAAWTRALSRSGIPAPELAPTRDGDVLTVVGLEGVPGPRQCDLLPWVEGRPLGSLEGGVGLDPAAIRLTYRTVGEIAARLHEHGATWEPPPGFVRPAWDVESLVGSDPAFGRFWELGVLSDAQRALLLRARDRARERLLAFGCASDRYGLVHGDLIPDNLLAGPQGVRLIDFDDCGPSWYAFELATSLFPLLDGPLPEAQEAYLEGYRAVRALPEEQLALLPSFFAARGLSYLGWPVGRSEMELSRTLAPFLAQTITRLSERYLADAL